jgi:hypothetical protein
VCSVLRQGNTNDKSAMNRENIIITVTAKGRVFPTSYSLTNTKNIIMPNNLKWIYHSGRESFLRHLPFKKVEGI